MMAWYVVHTHAQAEKTALTHLTRQGFEAYLPCHAKRRSHARKVEIVAAPLFPRYLFVRLDPEACRWRAIRSTIGVSHLVCRGDVPAAVPDGIVEAIRDHEDDTGMVRIENKPMFEAGQPVRFLRGAFADQIGRFACMSEGERVVVLLNLLGRDIQVRTSMEAVAAA